MDADGIRRLLRKACEQAGSRRAWARAHDVSNVYVADVLAGKREPGRAICEALGYRRLVVFQRLERWQKAAAE